MLKGHARQRFQITHLGEIENQALNGSAPQWPKVAEVALGDLDHPPVALASVLVANSGQSEANTKSQGWPHQPSCGKKRDENKDTQSGKYMFPLHVIRTPAFSWPSY